MADVATVNAKFTADTNSFVAQVAKAGKSVNQFQKDVSGASGRVTSELGAIDKFARRATLGLSTLAAVGGGALVTLGLKSFNAAARVQELDTTLMVLGQTTQYSYAQLIEQTKAVRDNGIELAAAQEFVTKFAKANLNLADASKVARVAQDLAVISQANSTQTASRLVHGIITQNSMVLRQAGIQKTAGEAYRMYAKEINKTSKSLTAQQKQQAIVNLILSEGARVTGVYEMSMTNAGKVLRSFARIVDDIQVALGEAGLNAFGPVILKAYEMVKAFSKTLREGGALYPVIQALGSVLRELVYPLEVVFAKSTQFFKNLEVGQTSVANIKQQLQDFLPIVLAVAGGFAAFGGANLLKLVPVFGAIAGALNPLYVGLAILVATTPELQKAFRDLFDAVKPLLPIIVDLAKNVASVLTQAVKVLASVISGLSTALSKITSKFKNTGTAADILTGAIVGLSTAFLLLKSRVVLVTTALLLLNPKLILATTAAMRLGTAMKALNVILRANPYIAVASAIVGIGTALFFTTRKTKEATTATDGLANAYREFLRLERLPGGKLAPPDLGKDVAEATKKVEKNLKQAVEQYNYFIRYEFAKPFLQGSDAARETIYRALSELKTVFDEQAKNLSKSKVLQITKTYEQIKQKLLGFVPQAEFVASEIERVSDELKEAYDALNDAIASRKASIEKFNDILRMPFGEPSELNKNLSAANATVDSIIGMYDVLVDTINQRFAGIDPAGRDSIIGVLNTQTELLIKAARAREVAVEKLRTAKDDLEQLQKEQRDFSKKMTESLKGFATAITDLSKTDAKATYTVIKTATGLVITQIQTAKKGVDVVTEQLRQRLLSITDFASNIQKLLAQGLNKDYIRQLLEAGPEAAGETVKVLAQASNDQLALINKLYSEIDLASSSFGANMSSVFYDNSVAMTQALVKGFQDEVDTIQLQMEAIELTIRTALEPLRDLGTSIGTDLAKGLYDSLFKEKTRLVELAKSIAQAIADAMADALKKIQVEGATKDIGDSLNPPVDPTTLENAFLQPVPLNPDGTFKQPAFVPEGLNLDNLIEELKGAREALAKVKARIAGGGLGTKAVAHLREQQSIFETQIQILQEEINKLRGTPSKSTGTSEARSQSGAGADKPTGIPNLTPSIRQAEALTPPKPSPTPVTSTGSSMPKGSATQFTGTTVVQVPKNGINVVINTPFPVTNQLTGQEIADAMSDAMLMRRS